MGLISLISAVAGSVATAAFYNNNNNAIINQVNGNIEEVNLANLAVTAAKLASNSVTGTKIALGSDARGDLIRRGASNYERLTPTTAGEHVVYDGTDSVFQKSPSFSVYRSANQSINASSATKVQFDNETFDTNSNFDSSTNYRFTPTVAGKYFISAIIKFAGEDQKSFILHIYKNGSSYHKANAVGSGTTTVGISGSAIIDMNGSTDYIEIYVEHNGSGALDMTGGATTDSVCTGSKID